MAENASNTNFVSDTLMPFDPAEWVERFKSTGGWWLPYGDNKISIGWMLQGFTNEQHLEARVIWKEVENDDDKFAAIRAHVLASGGSVVPHGHE